MINSFTGRHEFLSNFYRRTFYGPAYLDVGFGVEVVEYRSGEHCFQAHKATTPEDFSRLLNERTPLEVKRAGRQIRLRADWEAIKIDVMRFTVEQKFTDETMQRFLLETEDETLIEGNRHGDQTWGACWEQEPRIISTEEWWAEDHRGSLLGKNLLGRILMEHRDALRAAVSA